MKFTANSATPLSVDEKKRTLRVRFTDETRDDYDTVITYDGWDFSQFIDNPIVRLDHDRSAKAIVGRVKEIIEVPEERAHDAVIEFDTDEESEWAFGKAMRGFLRGVSAGFDVLQMEGDRIMQKVLREISLVSVPSNPQGLTRSANEGELSTKDAERMIERYERSAEFLKKHLARSEKENEEEESMKPEDVKKAIEEAVQPLVDTNKELAEKVDGLTTELETVKSQLADEKPKGGESEEEGSDTKSGKKSDGHEGDESEEDLIDEEEAKRILEDYDKDLDEEFTNEEEKE